MFSDVSVTAPFLPFLGPPSVSRVRGSEWRRISSWNPAAGAADACMAAAAGRGGRLRTQAAACAWAALALLLALCKVGRRSASTATKCTHQTCCVFHFEVCRIGPVHALAYTFEMHDDHPFSRVAMRHARGCTAVACFPHCCLCTSCTLMRGIAAVRIVHAHASHAATRRFWGAVQHNTTTSVAALRAARSQSP